MTNDAQMLISALQVSDSQFPCGAFAFSWGLEVLWREGRVGRDHLFALMEVELEDRWATFDRTIIYRAMMARSDTEMFADDAEVEAMSWSTALRTGSRRAGAGLLTIHRKLATPGAEAYWTAVRRGEAYGHFPVVQGAMFKGLDWTVRIALCVSGYGLLSGLGSAAVRLGLAGAIEVQQTMSALAPRLATLASEEPSETASVFNPLFDTAMMRHGADGVSLFSS